MLLARTSGGVKYQRLAAPRHAPGHSPATYVAWLLGHDPGRRIIVVSYSNDLAAEFTLAEFARWSGLLPYRAVIEHLMPQGPSKEP
jgi:hypothetical protein